MLKLLVVSDCFVSGQRSSLTDVEVIEAIDVEVNLPGASAAVWIHEQVDTAEERHYAALCKVAEDHVLQVGSIKVRSSEVAILTQQRCDARYS